MQDKTSITFRKSEETRALYNQTRALYNQTSTNFTNYAWCDSYFVVVTCVKREQDSEDTWIVTVCLWLC